MEKSRDIILQDNPEIDVYDVSGIPNKSLNISSFDALRNGAESDKDGWTIFAASNAASDIGFIELEKDILEHKKGDVIPYGKYYTLCIISLRNTVLTDSSLNLPIPTATEYITENLSLTNILSEISSTMGSTSRNYYFAPTSVCYAFQPTTKEDIKEEYKAHNWFLPSMGEALRLCYHMSRPAGDELAIFAKAKDKGIFKVPENTSSHIMTSSESTRDRAYIVRPLNYATGSFEKWRNYFIRKICAF